MREGVGEKEWQTSLMSDSDGSSISGGYGEDEWISDEELRLSNGETSQNCDDDPFFEEGLDEGDEQYDAIDDASSDFESRGDKATNPSERSTESRAEDQTHRHRGSMPPSFPRCKVHLPSEVVDKALISNATSLVSLAAFDVFFLSLM
jgi:hypothetical protein